MISSNIRRNGEGPVVTKNGSSKTIRSYSPTAGYQPTHVDVNVAGCVVYQHETSELQNKLHLEHLHRWNDLLMNFDGDLEGCMKNEVYKHEQKIKKNKKTLMKDLNQLFKYEAREIRKNRWEFEKCPRETKPLAVVLTSWRDIMHDNKLEAILKCEEAQQDIVAYKLSCLKKQHQQEMNFRRLEWKVKAKDNWNRIETKILASFETEMRQKEDEAAKKHKKELDSKQRELEPKLNLVKQQRNVLAEKKTMLQQELNAMQVKEKSGSAILDKLVASFECFVMNTKNVELTEARNISREFMLKEKKLTN